MTTDYNKMEEVLQTTRKSNGHNYVFAQTTILTNIYTANRIFTNITMMADKHNIIIIYSIYIVLYNALLYKALCEYYKLDSDFINLGFIMKHVFSILKRILCTNTCKYI